jgi:hypothetical protein
MFYLNIITFILYLSILNNKKKGEMVMDVLKITKKVLDRLSAMDYEIDGGSSSEQLIFPSREELKGVVKRISEQELRFLFIEEFKKSYPDLFYSIETPTKEKYKFGESYDEVKVNKNGQSASHDMCVFKRIPKKYERISEIGKKDVAFFNFF